MFRRSLPILATVTICSLALPAVEASIIATGSLDSPNDVDVVLSFGLNVDSRVSVRTMSYAGGSVLFFKPTPGDNFGPKTAERKVFARGGFDPITAIRQGSNYILTNDDGINAQPDAVTGVRFDSQIDGELKAGHRYEVVVSQYDNFPPNFNGSWIREQINGEVSPYEDVTGDIRTNYYGVVRVTLNDIVNNAISISPTSLSGTSNSMIADYTVPIPGIGSNLQNGVGYTLKEAASFGYFDHFNWYQTIDKLTGEFNRSTGIDPLYGGNTPLVDPADAFPWYWDEVDASNLLVDRSDELLSSNISGDITLNFTDSPNFGTPGYSAEFTTYLAGVKSDLREGMVFGPGFSNTAFRWRYTQTTEKSGLVTVRNTDPLLGGGGVVEFLGFLDEDDWTADRIRNLNLAGITVAAQLPDTVAVPEPASIFSVCFLLLIVALRRLSSHFWAGGMLP